MPLSTTPTFTPVPVMPWGHSASAPMSCVPRFAWSPNDGAAAVAAGTVVAVAESTCTTRSGTMRVTWGSAAIAATLDVGELSATQPMRSKRWRSVAPAASTARSVVASIEVTSARE
jgi:hypothetical protein